MKTKNTHGGANRGQGRKPDPENKKVSMSIRIKPKTKAKLYSLAPKGERNTVIEEALEEYLLKLTKNN